MDLIDKIITQALKEDIPTEDITTDSLFKDDVSEALFIAKADGIISGIDVARRVFTHLDDTVYFKAIQHDGAPVEKGDLIAIIKGKTAALLKGERTALNLMQRMSGISTLTHQFVTAVSGTKTQIYDTRKTAPNLRILDKQAVTFGGGTNHRFSLSDQALIKDNHIQVAGSITRAVEIIRTKYGASVCIEVEVDSIEGFNEALTTSCDIIMLDNMSLETMQHCVNHNQGKILEASGNMTLDRVRLVADTGVDRISVGALTHSAPAFDITLKFQS